MLDNIYESTNSYFYSKFSKEFCINKKDEIKKYIRKKYKKNINYYCFIIIKNNKKVLALEKEYIKEHNFILKKIKSIFRDKEPLDRIERKIDYRIRNIDKRLRKKISCKVIMIADTKENKYFIKEIRKQICEIDNLLNSVKNESSFTKLIFENKLYIFSIGVIVLSMTLVYELSSIGILINFLSMDTLTLIVNNSINYILTLALFGFFIFFFIYIFTVINMDILFSKIACKDSKFNSLNLFKTLSSICLISYMVFIFTIIVFNFGSNNDNNRFFNEIVKDYMSQTREPSLREILYKGKSKIILLMGKDTKFIYFVPIDTIKNNIKNKIEEQICRNEEVKKSYIDSLFRLLNIKQDLENSKEESDLNFIGNRRYTVLNISDVSFLDNIPIFKEVFCGDIKSK